MSSCVWQIIWFHMFNNCVLHYVFFPFHSSDHIDVIPIYTKPSYTIAYWSNTIKSIFRSVWIWRSSLSFCCCSFVELVFGILDSCSVLCQTYENPPRWLLCCSVTVLRWNIEICICRSEGKNAGNTWCGVWAYGWDTHYTYWHMPLIMHITWCWSIIYVLSVRLYHFKWHSKECFGYMQPKSYLVMIFFFSSSEKPLPPEIVLEYDKNDRCI